MITDNGQTISLVVHHDKVAEKMMVSVEDDQAKEIVLERRRSERLKKDVHLTTMEKNEAIAKKRTLEGNSNIPHAIANIEHSILNNLARDGSVSS